MIDKTLPIGTTLYEVEEKENYDKIKETFVDADGIEWYRDVKKPFTYTNRKATIVAIIKSVIEGDLPRIYEHMREDAFTYIIQYEDDKASFYYIDEFEYPNYFLKHIDAVADTVNRSMRK